MSRMRLLFIFANSLAALPLAVDPRDPRGEYLVL